MRSSDRALLVRVYAAFNARDIEGVLALLDRDVDWPNGMEGGRVHGHAELRVYWTRQWRSVDPHVEPKGFSDDGEGRVAVKVHQRIRDRSGALVGEKTVKHVYEIHDGLVRRMDISERPRS